MRKTDKEEIERGKSLCMSLRLFENPEKASDLVPNVRGFRFYAEETENNCYSWPPEPVSFLNGTFF